MRVFLGGTCNGSDWRDRLIPLLKIDYFNPVVADWTPECQEQELRERETADFVLYVLTPKMVSSPQLGYYSIAEVVDDSNKRPHKTVFCLADEGGETFSVAQTKSLAAVGGMVQRNGGYWVGSLEMAAEFLNTGARQAASGK